MKGVTQKHLEQVKLGDSGDMMVSVISGLRNKEGYTRLEVDFSPRQYEVVRVLRRISRHDQTPAQT